MMGHANSARSSTIARLDARKHRIDVIRDAAGGSDARSVVYRGMIATGTVGTVVMRDATTGTILLNRMKWMRSESL
jgi:hypothetical protein